MGKEERKMVVVDSTFYFVLAIGEESITKKKKGNSTQKKWEDKGKWEIFYIII